MYTLRYQRVLLGAALLPAVLFVLGSVLFVSMVFDPGFALLPLSWLCQMAALLSGLAAMVVYAVDVCRRRDLVTDQRVAWGIAVAATNVIGMLGYWLLVIRRQCDDEQPPAALPASV